MSEFPKRGEHSYYHNEIPIVDIHEVLDFLHQSEQSAGDPHTMEWNRQLGVWELGFKWYSHGDSGGDRAGTDYYQIDQAVARQLIDERLVEQRVQKTWGASYVVEGEYVISAAGTTKIKEHADTLKQRALKMIVPGTHTDLIGEIQDGGGGREHRLYGEPFREFWVSNGPGWDKIRVYPQSGRVEKVS